MRKVKILHRNVTKLMGNEQFCGIELENYCITSKNGSV